MRIHVIAALLLSVAASASAGIVFNFERYRLAAPETGALTDITFSLPDLAMTIRREGGSRFDVVLIGGGTGFGTRTLSPLFDVDGGAFVLSFSRPLTQVTLQLGDAGEDSDQVQVAAHRWADGKGPVVATAAVDYGTRSLGEDGPATVTLTGPLYSLVVSGGSSTAPMSLYVDNIDADPVPEPTTAIALAACLGGLAARRARCRA